MANKKKKSPLVIILAFIFVLGIVCSVIDKMAPRSHPYTDSWYEDKTGRFIDADNDSELKTSMMRFYNEIGVQPFIYVTTYDRGTTNTTQAYHDIFDDDEHVLIYVLEYQSRSTGTTNLIARQVLSDMYEDPTNNIITTRNYEDDSEDNTTYYYEIYVYAGSDSLKRDEEVILSRNISLVNLSRHSDKNEELTTAFNKSLEQIDKSNESRLLFQILTFCFAVIPVALFIIFIRFIVKIANNSSKNTNQTNTTIYVTPTTKTAVNTKPAANSTVIPVFNSGEESSPKPAFKPLPQTEPIKPQPIAKPAPIIKSAEPIIATEVTTTPEVTTAPESEINAVPEVNVAAPEGMTFDPISAITPIGSIDIKPINFDLEANNIFDNIEDVNFDVPNVIDTNTNDWGDL